MSLVVRDRGGRPVATLSPAALGRWLAVVGPSLVVVAQVRAVAPDGAWWPGVVLLLLAVVSAAAPDSGAPLLAVGVTACWWLLAVPEPTAGPVLVVALALLVLHVAAAHAAVGPPGRVAERRILAGVVARTAAVAAATGAVAALALAVGSAGVVPGVVGVAMAAVAALAWFTTRQ